MPERVVVIGGDAAGMTAATQARRRRRDRDDLAIVVLERGRHVSYSACGIPYVVGGVVGGFDALVVRTPEDLRSDFDIDVRLGHEAVAIDLERRVVAVRALDRGGAELEEAYDQLVIATGATPVRPPLPGIDAAGVFGVQTLDDGIAVDRWVEAREARTGVVVGGGYIGLEMAEALVLRGLDVTLIEAGAQPMATLDPDMGARVAEAVRRSGVDLRTGDAVEGFDVDGGDVRAVRTTSGLVPADVVVLGIGVSPNSGLAREAGVAVGAGGGIAVDQRMRTSAPGVWAAGDCVEVFHRVSRRPATIALGTHANKQGRVIGINLGGGYATFPGVVGTAASKICRFEVARTGLATAEAEDAGFDVIGVVTESTTRAGYYPDAASIVVKLVAERRSGRLLGAQLIGEEGAAKRIDVLATALWHEMTVEDLTGLDLSYAPPFSPVWDPVLIAARRTAEARERGV